MKRMLVALLATVSLSLFNVAQAEFVEGQHYGLINPQPPVGKGKIEVAEFFWWGCPHCNDFHPFVKKWLDGKADDVEFTLIPIQFNKPAQFHAQVFYALDLIGALDKVHEAFFDAMHKQKKRLRSLDEIEPILQANGVDVETFRKAMNSFAVQTKVRRAQVLARRYEIRGVPTVVVDGRYRSGNVRDFNEMIEVIDYLVDKVRQERKDNN